MSFVTGSTPFGYFDNDTQFSSDADKIVNYVTRKMGGSQLTVELEDKDIYSAFEESVLEYSFIVNSYQAKSVLTDFLGQSTGSLSGSENKFPHRTFELLDRMAEPYSSYAGVGGHRTLLSASVVAIAGQQNIELSTITSSSLSGSRIHVKDVYYYSPSSGYRFFNTTSAINYLNNQFSFESYTPETVFYLLPIWEDVLRASQMDLSSRVRRSNYYYNIIGTTLKIYPAPNKDTVLNFTYFAPSNPTSSNFNDTTINGVSNLSNIPFGILQYSKINSMGKNWIRRFSFALCQEMLGHVRSKMNSIPIPNGDLMLNGAELISEGKTLQDMLREELKQMFEETTYQNISAKEAETSDNIRRQLSNIPNKIFIG